MYPACDQAMKGAKNTPTKGLSKFASMQAELESSQMEREFCLKARPPPALYTNIYLYMYIHINMRTWIRMCCMMCFICINIHVCL